MTDNEYRGELLKALYDNRKDEWTQIGANSFNDSNAREAIRIADQLAQYNLIEFRRLNPYLVEWPKSPLQG
jgi:hypothetical protein